MEELTGKQGPIVETPEGLRAERAATVDQVWRNAEARLSQPLSAGYNIAVEACDRWADDDARVAMIITSGAGDRTEWTYRELKLASERLASGLRAQGVGPGERVAGVMERGVAPFLVALATWRLGAVYVPLYTAFGPGALAYRLGQAAPKAVVVDNEYLDVTMEAAEQAAVECAIVPVDPDHSGRGATHALWALIEENEPLPEVAPTTVDDPAVLMFTSGTTGPPKGCVQVHGVVFSLQPFLLHSLALTESDLLFAGADPGWSYGLFTSGLAVQALGLPRVIPLGRLAAGTWVDIMRDEGVTYVAGAPTMLRVLVKQALETGGLPPRMRGATCAGEPLDEGLVRRWKNAGGGLIQNTYGQSELGMVLADLVDGERPWVPGTFGDFVPGFTVEVRDPVSGDLAESGVLTVRNPRYQATSGYWYDDEKWAGRWLADGVFSTGDLMSRDEDGRWRFIGRDDDLIITSGYNVGPAEVESILSEHPAVDEVAVVAAPDELRGSVVRAVLSLASDRPEGLESELREMVTSRLGRHAAPRIIDIVRELPKTETGKVKRVEIRNSYNRAGE